MRYPMKLTAPLKDYLWGGTRLKEEYGKETALEKVAESWELACHRDGHSVIANGPAEGQTLEAWLTRAGREMLGTNAARFPYFPLLVKLIDAHDDLSVQVHPDDDYALRIEGEYGKTEMWYIVDAAPGAELLYGFRREITKEEFRQRIADHTLLDAVCRVPVKKGDVFFIPAGTLHAIGKGILICEIQQNSNTTYRVYDYGRVGADGKLRDLHIDKGILIHKVADGRTALLHVCTFHSSRQRLLIWRQLRFLDRSFRRSWCAAFRLLHPFHQFIKTALLTQCHLLKKRDALGKLLHPCQFVLTHGRNPSIC